MRILRLNHHAKRLGEIVTVLGKYGLADWLSGVDYAWISGPLRAFDNRGLANLTTEARIREALAELGPTFIKLGQILSTRPDLVGHELAQELALLQRETKPDPPDVVREIIKEELGSFPEDLFVDFEEEAFASASIAQVHRAKLPTGEAVVLKVQHSNIHEVIKQDLEILLGLAELAEKHAPWLRAYRPKSTTSEFRHTLWGELDFTREFRNLVEFERNFRDDDTAHIPKPYAEFSSRRVLTMERLDGISVADIEPGNSSEKDLDVFARRGAEIYLNMIFRDGFYHADPHPGNLLYLEDHRVGLLDCGMVGRIDEQLRGDLEDLLLAVVSDDSDRLTDLIIRIGSIPVGFDRSLLRSEISSFVAEYRHQSVKNLQVTEALNRMVEIIRDHHLLLPTHCTLLLKTLVMLDGTSRRLSPSFNLAELILPHQVEILRRRHSPKRILRRLERSYRDWDRLIETFPRDAADILERVQQGRFEVNLEHRRLDSIVNRLVLGLLTTALLLGSSLLWSFEAAPMIAGVSLFGVCGYAAAIILGVRLLRAIKRSGNITPR